MLKFVSKPSSLVQNGVDRVERVKIWFPEAKDFSYRVPVDGNLILTVGALEHERIGEAGHGLLVSFLLCRLQVRGILAWSVGCPYGPARRGRAFCCLELTREAVSQCEYL
jgi:hypothetical protein